MSPNIENICAACGKEDESHKICTGCRLVKYCNRDCQISHRKAHKKACKKEQEKASKTSSAPAKNGSHWNNADLSSRTECLPELKKNHTRAMNWIVDNFVKVLMMPILGTSMYESSPMWNVLYKAGAKERIHSHMVKSFMDYISTCPKYQSISAVERLMSLDWSMSLDLDQEPIFRPMQDELYHYLKTEEVQYD